MILLRENVKIMKRTLSLNFLRTEKQGVAVCQAVIYTFLCKNVAYDPFVINQTKVRQ